MTGRVLINDTTLRDGEQSPGVAFQASEKIATAEALYVAGIEAVEIGAPAMDEEECARIRQVRHQLPGVTLMTWCRIRAGEIRQSADLGMDWVDTSISASDKLRQYKLREGLPLPLERLTALIHLARTPDPKVCTGCEDASRTSDAMLQDTAHPAREAGATRLYYADIVGILDPLTAAAQIVALCRVWLGELEIYAHNDLGLATANALAAVRVGAISVNTTVLGLDERTDNVAPETAVLGLERCLEVKTGARFAALLALCGRVALATRRLVDLQQLLVGELVLIHESGAHVAALSRNSESYRTIDPALLGRGYRLVLGKHFGRQAVNGVLDRTGYHLTSVQIDQLLPALRRSAENGKRSPWDDELAAIYHVLCSAKMLQARG